MEDGSSPFEGVYFRTICTFLYLDISYLLLLSEAEIFTGRKFWWKVATLQILVKHLNLRIYNIKHVIYGEVLGGIMCYVHSLDCPWGILESVSMS